LLARLASLTGWRADAASVGFGVLAAAALPPVCAVPVLLIAVPGLLTLIGSTRGFASAARRGWWFGLGHHIVGLYWITEAILFEAARLWWVVPLAVPALAAVLAIFIAVPAGLARLARPGWPRVLTLAGGWVLADLVRQFVATGFPWNPWGSVWEFPGAPGDVMIQAAAWVGTPGMTFLTVMLAGVPVLSWRWRVAGLAFLGGWAGFGMMRLASPLPAPPGITVILAQGDVAQGQKWDREFAIRIFRRYLALTQDGIAQAHGAPAVVIWPETASPFLLQTDAAARAAISDAAQGAPALVGAIRFDRDRRPRNSLFALLPDGTLDGFYDKWHLVPFGEYQPSWFPLPFQVVPGGGFQPGRGPATLRVPGLPPIGPLICYEAIFPGQVIDESERPAWMVNITNDAWFGNSTGPRQHLAAARMRAVEEGLPLVRAANTGISAVFDARGHEITRLGMNREGVVVASLPAALPPTPFARFRLLVPAAMGVLGLGLGLSAGSVLARRRARV
jgi:apolipoprotein N-acyltransferase